MSIDHLLHGRGEQTQGRCRPCRIRFVWRGKPLLRDALCPRCKQPLARTTHELRQYRTVVETPLWRVQS